MIPIYLERGRRRVFAVATDWPGWARSGTTDEQAIETLLAYRDRYAAAVAPAKVPAARDVAVTERLRGDATTDFGAPSIAPAADDEPLTATQMKRRVALLRSCWAAFDAAAKKAARTTLATGPRGGGRQAAKMIEHVHGADCGYMSRLGRRPYKPDGPPASDMAAMREAFLAALEARRRGEPDQRTRATSPMWTPRFAIRRSAWHALDHAWEIHDRS